MSTRRLTLMGLTVAALSGCEATPPASQGAPAVLEHVQVHEVPGLTKRQVCTAARDWAAITFKDSKAVVEVFDPEEGKLIGKGRVQAVWLLHIVPVDFTLIVECRDGRARASYTNLMVSHGGGGAPVAGVRSDQLHGNSMAEVRRIDALLAEYLKSPRVGGQW